MHVLLPQGSAGDLAFSVLVSGAWLVLCGWASCLKKVLAAHTGDAQHSWSLWPGPAAPFVSDTGRPGASEDRHSAADPSEGPWAGLWFLTGPPGAPRSGALRQHRCAGCVSGGPGHPGPATERGGACLHLSGDCARLCVWGVGSRLLGCTGVLVWCWGGDVGGRLEICIS